MCVAHIDVLRNAPGVSTARRCDYACVATRRPRPSVEPDLVDAVLVAVLVAATHGPASGADTSAGISSAAPQARSQVMRGMVVE